MRPAGHVAGTATGLGIPFLQWVYIQSCSANLSDEIIANSQRGSGTRRWGVEEVDLAGLLLKREIHQKRTIAMNGLGSYSASPLARDMLHANIRNQALQVFQKNIFAE